MYLHYINLQNGTPFYTRLADGATLSIALAARALTMDLVTRCATHAPPHAVTVRFGLSLYVSLCE